MHRHGRDSTWDWELVVAWCQAETRRTIGGSPAAEDAAQEAALRAWRRRRQCRTPGAARPWVAAIARREALRAVARRPEEEPLDDDAPTPDPGAAVGDLAYDVRAAVSRLDPESRGGGGGGGGGGRGRVGRWFLNSPPRPPPPLRGQEGENFFPLGAPCRRGTRP